MEKMFVLYWFLGPLTVFIGGIIMLKFPPKNINSFIGYRTRRSCKNIDTWNYSQYVAGKYFVKFSIAMFILAAIFAFLTIVNLIKGDITTVVMILELVLLFSAIPCIEKKIKRKFDK